MHSKILTDVKNRRGQLDVAKVARADLDVLLARRARVHAVDGAELGVVEALLARLLLLLVHGLGVDDVDDAHGLDLLGREQAELDLLDGPERTFRHCWRAGRHVGGVDGGVRVGGSLKSAWRAVAGCREPRWPRRALLRVLKRAYVGRGSGAPACCACKLGRGARRAEEMRMKNRPLERAASGAAVSRLGPGVRARREHSGGAGGSRGEKTRSQIAERSGLMGGGGGGRGRRAGG